MDGTTAAILNQIAALGYVVTLQAGKIKAIDARNGQTHIVICEDEYRAACELAQAVGIQLDDG